MASNTSSRKKPPKSGRAAIGSKGGLARAESLSKEERSAIAKRAAAERWAKVAGLPRETHSGSLNLGSGIPCSVLNNGMRVFSVNGLVRAFGSGAKGRVPLNEDGPMVPSVLAAANIRPFISPELMSQLESPVMYLSKHGGRNALGYEAMIIRKMCDALLDARAAGVLRLPQLPIARAAEALVRAFADVGIVALVDEATGYQDDRARDELQRLVEAYVVEDMRPWVGLFPSSFFKQVYRIHGWPYKDGVTQGPRYVGKFINKYVYGRLPPAVLVRLRELNPVIDKRRKHKHFQFLTDDIGEPTVDRHLASVTTLMSVATDQRHFDDMFKIAFPKLGEQMLMNMVVNPPVLTAASEDNFEDVDEDPEEAAVDAQDDTAPVTDDSVGSVRERIVAAMQGRGPVRSTVLAKLVYGDDSETTMNKLRARLAQYRAQGIMESTSKGYWKLR